MSKESAISAIERGALSELCHVLEESELDIRSETLDSKGQSALHIASTRGHLDIVEYLIIVQKCSVTVEDVYGHTPLLLSLIHEHWKIADILLQNTPTSKINEHLYGVQRHNIVTKVAKEALCESRKKGYHSLVGFINEIIHVRSYPKVDCTHKAIKYEASIQKARFSGALHRVQYLLKEMKCTIPYDMPGIHVACILGATEKVISAINNNGQSILGTTDRYGTAAIHYAAYEPNILSMIIGRVSKDGVVLNLCDKRGNTVLHHCVKSECVDSVKHVIEVPGCKLNQVNVKGDAPLHLACKQMNTAAVQLLVANERCDVNIRNKKGNTALHIAAYIKSNGIKMMKCLLRSGKCDLNQVNNKHKTSLHVACKYGHDRVVEILLRSGVDAQAVDMDGNTALYFAHHNLRFKCLRLLGKHLNQLNVDGDAVLHILCGMKISKEKLPECVKFLRETKGLDINKFNKKGETPLHIACRWSYGDVVGTLVEMKCDVNACDGLGNTALYIAVRSEIDRLQKVQHLLKSDECNPNVCNKRGCVPLHAACRGGSIAVIEMLVTDQRCDVNIQDENGNTPLHTTIRTYNRVQWRKVQLLLQRSACDLNLTNKDGSTPLHIASGKRDVHVLELLVADKRCDVNIQDMNGDTALHRGVNSAEIVKYLMEKCPQCDACNTKGQTPFHKAIEKGALASVELFIKNGVDIQRSDINENAPIHIACQYSRLETLKVILGCKTCDPNQQNANGDTALHIVSRNTLSLETKLQYLQLLLCIPGINPEVLNNEHLKPFEASEKDGNTVLHNACAKGESTMVQFLIENGADVLRTNRHGNAPIHIACMNFRLKTLRILLSCKHCNPNQQNEDGDTALHIVCKMRNVNEFEYLKLLMSVPGINPNIANHAGLTLIEVAGTNYAIIDALKKVLIPKSTPIQAYLKLFVVGNSGAGKSTLIKAVTTQASHLLKYSPFQRMKYVNPRDVSPLTAGIVPIPFNSKHFGNAVLYDFAGQHEYYSSHAAVMENLILPSPPLFLLLIDISKPMEEIKEELLYWWYFIENQSQKASSPPHVLLGGSRKDIVKQRGRSQLHTIGMEIEACISDLQVSFKFAGFFPLDCRRLSSQGLTKLLTQLLTTCMVLREAVDINLHCHILKSFLTTPVFEDKVYCKISDIVDQIETSDSYLPQHSIELIPLLKALNDQGHILLLQNHTDENQSWVILKPAVLLTDVNGSIFAPDNFHKHSIQFAMSTGVVTYSKLKERFIKYNHDVIIEYLIHHEFCFRVKDRHTLGMITNNELPRTQSTDDHEKYYFFPALVSVESPEHIHQPHKSVTFKCGWFYVCPQKAKQLTTRFLHVLILRLAFACEPTDNPTEAESVVLLRRCSVWKHGIAWLNNYGIETIVEVDLQCHWVAVMMRCSDNEKVQCAELRSKVIKTVLKTRKDFCPAITMKEYLIDPLNLLYPFEGRKLTLYSMSELANVIVEGKPLVMDTTGKNLISIPELLPFEPYLGMYYMIEMFFSGDTSLAVTPDDIIRLDIKCHSMLTELKKAFKHDIRAFQMECAGAECTEIESCNTLFHILQRSGFKTWKHFEERFSRFSIFCGKNPMVRRIRQVRFMFYNTDCYYAQDIAGRVSSSLEYPFVSCACFVVNACLRYN